MKKFAFLFTALSLILTITSCSDDEPGMLQSAEYEYTIHNGQTVPSAAYKGSHPNDFTAKMGLQEMENGNTMITLTLNNTVDGATYHMHAHDAADASTTPNGTPYDESPNIDVFVRMVTGNGGTVAVSQEAKMSFKELTESYEGFFVVHDPLQAVSTVDISTYLAVGAFARTQSNPSMKSETFEYSFNIGQLVPAFAYSGSHATNLTATIRVDELAGNQARTVVTLNNTIDGQVYRVHAHDMADASTTPNGTPYNESPNLDVFASSITGNGKAASKAVISKKTFTDITTTYDGFFVVHDPLQALSTTDPTTYVILGIFAR